MFVYLFNNFIIILSYVDFKSNKVDGVIVT